MTTKARGNSRERGTEEIHKFKWMAGKAFHQARRCDHLEKIGVEDEDFGARDRLEAVEELHGVEPAEEVLRADAMPHP